MPDNRIAVLLREWWSLRKEKTIIVAIVLQLAIALFSSFILVGLVSVLDPGQTSTDIDIAVTGAEKERIIENSGNVQNLEVSEYQNLSAAYSAFQRGDVEAIVYGFSKEQGRLQVTVLSADTGIRNTVVVLRVRALLDSVQNDLRGEYSDTLSYDRIEIDAPDGSSIFFGFTYTVLIPILVFLPAFISGSLSSDTLTEGIVTGTIHLLEAAPIDAHEIVQAKSGAMILLAPIQSVLFLLLLTTRGVAIQNIHLLTVLSIGITLLVSSLGAFFSLKFRDRSKVQFSYSLSVLSIFSASTLLPETPINTVAKLSLDSATQMTYILCGLYFIVGVIAFSLLSVHVKQNGIPTQTS